jgi:hypothetical protein
MNLVDLIRDPEIPKGAKTMAELRAETGLPESKIRYRMEVNNVTVTRVGRVAYYSLSGTKSKKAL